MYACADYSVAIFPGKYVHIYYGRATPTDVATLLARGGSNRLQVYLAYGERKLGSNRLRWRDMVMMQSALITCFQYII